MMKIKSFNTKLAVISSILFTLSLPHTLADGIETSVSKNVAENVASYSQWNTPFDLIVNGKTLTVKGEMVNTHLLVPLRSVFEAAGASVTWDSSHHAWSAHGEGFTASQRLGDDQVIVNGKTYKLDQSTILNSGAVFVPSRLVELALGLELRWNSSDRTLTASELPKSGFSIESDAFTKYGDIPMKYAHDGIRSGENISFPVHWINAPKGTRSYAVVLYDVNPIADNFIHWSVLNIPASSDGLNEGSSGKLDDGSIELNSYYGVEPPRHSGDHLYRLAVYALDTEKLELPADPPVFMEQLEPLLQKHALGYATYDGFFRNE